MESCSLLWPGGWVIETVLGKHRSNNLGTEAKRLFLTLGFSVMCLAVAHLRHELNSPTQVGDISFHTMLFGVGWIPSLLSTFHSIPFHMFMLKQLVSFTWIPQLPWGEFGEWRDLWVYCTMKRPLLDHLIQLFSWCSTQNVSALPASCLHNRELDG